MIGDSRQIPSLRVEIATASTTPESSSQRRREAEIDEELAERGGERSLALDHERRQGQREHGAGDVVERGLRDDRLSHLGADPHVLEERDEDRRVGRGEDRADEEAHLEGHVESDRGDRAGHEGRDEDAGDRQQAEAGDDRAEDGEREAEPAVEEDHRDAERQEDLDRDRVEREVEQVGDVRAEHGAGGQEDDHARDPEEAGDDLGDEAGREDEREGLDDVLRGHRVNSPRCR